MDVSSTIHLTTAALLDGLGLSPQRAVQLLKDIAKNNPAFARTARKAINAIQNGGYIPSMRYIGPKMKAELDKDQPRVARDRPVFARRLEEGIQRSAAIQQGINDNRDFNDQLRDALNADKNVDNQSKAVANAALDDLRRDLRQDTSVSMAEQIEADALEKATDPMVVRNYVTPYVDRVRKQQGADDVTADLPPVENFVDLRVPEVEPPKRSHREIGEELMVEQGQRYGRDLDPYNDGGDFETVAQAMTSEAQMQMDRMPDAADWYDQDVKEALQRLLRSFQRSISLQITSSCICCWLQSLLSATSLASTGVTPVLLQCTTSALARLVSKALCIRKSVASVKANRQSNDRQGIRTKSRLDRARHQHSRPHDQQTWRGWHPRVGD